MNRLSVIGLATAFLASACGGEPAAPAPEQPADTPPAAAAPDPTMLPTPQQNSTAALSVTCGGQPYSVAFNDFAATLTYDDGATAELAQQPATADTEPGVIVYSNGQVSFAKSGEGASSVIRFARARMAWEDCVIAQNCPSYFCAKPIEDFAMRTVLISLGAALALAACGGEPETPVVNEPAPETAAAPETAPPTPAIADAGGGRIGTMNLMCGGESFRVAFLDTHAAIVSADGTQTTELPVLPAGDTSEPGVTVYSDGMQQFAKSGGMDTPTVIRYAKARMAWQDCAIAQN